MTAENISNKKTPSHETYIKNIKHRLLYINMLFLCGILSGACNKEMSRT